MGKTPEGMKRTDIYRALPENYFIIMDKSHKFYDPRVEMELNEGLVRDVMAKGILQPIIARKDGERVMVLAGRQRVRAAIEANKRFAEMGDERRVEVPCRLVQCDDHSAYKIMIAENLNRTDETILEKAYKAQKLIEYYNSSLEDVALTFNITENQVRNWLTLFDLDNDVLDLVREDKIAAMSAVEFAKFPRDEQGARVREFIEQGQKEGAKPTIVRAKSVVRGTIPTTRMQPKKTIEQRMLEPMEIPSDVVETILANAEVEYGGPLPENVTELLRAALEDSFKAGAEDALSWVLNTDQKSASKSETVEGMKTKNASTEEEALAPDAGV